MARYKDDNRDQTKVIPVAFDRQMLPSSFEYSLSVKRHPVSGHHNRETPDYFEAESIDGYLTDTGFRSRTPRFKDYQKPPARNNRKDRERFTQSEFTINRDGKTCRCPAGHALWLKAEHARIGQHVFMQFQAYEKDCANRGPRRRCLKDEHQPTPRQINVALDTTHEHMAGVIERMKRKIDSPQGLAIYDHRLGTLEPIFGHVTDAIGIKAIHLSRQTQGESRIRSH